MWTTRQGRLLFIFAVLAAVAWWLLRGLIEEPAKGPRGRVPEHVITDFSAIETDPQGRPQRRLVATQLRQFVAEDLTELDRPRLTLFGRDQGPPWEVEADRGLVLARGEELHLLDAVRIDRVGGPETRSVRLATEELKVWPKREYAQGDQPVRQESDADWLTAAGIRLWYATPARAEYPGRVHVFIAPTDP